MPERCTEVGAQVNDLVHSNGNLYAVTRNGVYICTDSSENWTKLGKGLKYVPVVALAVMGSGLYPATKRESIWRLPLLKLKHTILD